MKMKPNIQSQRSSSWFGKIGTPHPLRKLAPIMHEEEIYTAKRLRQRNGDHESCFGRNLLPLTTEDVQSSDTTFLCANVKNFLGVSKAYPTSSATLPLAEFSGKQNHGNQPWSPMHQKTFHGRFWVCETPSVPEQLIRAWWNL